MSYKSNTEFAQDENIIFSFFKGLIVSMLLSFALVILFAFSLKWFSIDDKYIFVGTMIIKAISVSVGAIIAIKGHSKGLFKGIMFGIIYILFAFVIFSLMAGSFSFDKSSILDLVASSILGGVIGIIKN